MSVRFFRKKIRRHHDQPHPSNQGLIPLFGCSESPMHSAWKAALWREYNNQKRLRRNAQPDLEQVAVLTKSGKKKNAAVTAGHWVLLNEHWKNGNVPSSLVTFIVTHICKRTGRRDRENITQEVYRFFDDTFERCITLRQVAIAGVI